MADNKRLKILAIDDDALDVAVLRRRLAGVLNLEFTLEHASTPEQGMNALADADVDVVFLDYRLGAHDGEAVLQDIRAQGDLRPIIVLTGEGDEYIATTVMRAGADDYIAKRDLTPETLRRSLELARLRQKERQTEARQIHCTEVVAQHLAETNFELTQASRCDPLTRLLNRTAWEESITLEHERAQRYGRLYGVLMIDVDHFKQLNDTLGHPAGDECLVEIARLLQESCRSMEVVGRYGGEEFVILVPETDGSGAHDLAERVQHMIAERAFPHPANGTLQRVSVSIGVATASGAEDGWQPVVKAADQALYEAKNRGRNRVWPPPLAQAGREDAETLDSELVILAIDDDDADAELLRRNLRRIPDMPFTFLHVNSSEQGLRALSEHRIGLVFLDYMLGAQSGLDVLRQIRASGYIGPVIAFTGQADEYAVADLIRCGGDDYVAKDDSHPEILKRAINNALAQEARRSAERLNKQLVFDLQTTKHALEERNKRLAELYSTAHQFVDNVSHEFRTPLTVIKEFTSILRDGLAGETNDEQREYLEIIHNRVGDLTIMVDDMLDISKLEAGLLGVSRRRCTIAEIVEKVAPTLSRKASARNVELTTAIEAGLPTVYCDPEKAGRVIINLTVNALKFANEGGHVQVWARPAPNEAALLIGVTDDGPGIAPENVTAIFERFRQIEGNVRASTKGFGLGLNIAKELVHLNLGDISVESEVGAGSTFSFTLPLADPSALMQRYLGRTNILGASLLRVTCNAEAPELLAEIEELLQRQLRRNDLLVYAGRSKWLMVIANDPEGESEPIAERIPAVWSEANRNRPGAALPDLELQLLCTCDSPKRTREITRLFEQECCQAELCEVDA